MAFAAGWLLSWPALIILAILGIIFEANDGHKMAVFLAIVAAVVSYFFFGLTLTQLAYYGAAYVGAGLIWSFWRYKRHCDKMVEKHKGETLEYRQRVVERMRPSNMISQITMWIMAWPFSAVENIAGDLIVTFQSLVTRFFRGVYNRVFDSASAELLRNGK